MHASLLRILLVVAVALPLRGAMRGGVFDVQGDPVAGARVAAYRAETPAARRARILGNRPRVALGETTTGDDGAFSFDWKLGGLVELRIERDGFAPARELVSADDQTLLVDLTPAARRTGRVTANGKPLRDATVIAYMESSPAWTTRTGEDGTYSIPDPKSWAARLAFIHPDFAPLSHDDPSRLDAAMEPGTTIAGNVNDARGRAVAKATVNAGEWSSATTNDDGNFVLRHVPATEKKVVAFAGNAFGTVTRDPKNTAIRIEPLRSIAGTVRDSAGRPLEGVPVIAYVEGTWATDRWRDTNSAVTDAKENYAIEHGGASEYEVMAFGTPAIEFDEVTVSLRDRASARADLTAKKLDFFRGVVVDEQKRPVAGAVVQYTSAPLPLVYGYFGAEEVPSARSGRDGRFTIRGERSMSVTGMAVRLQALHRAHAVGVSEPLHEADAANISIVLPAGIELAGLIADAEGKPIAGAGVVLLQDPSGAVAMPVESMIASELVRPFAMSDATGRFTVRLNKAPHDLGVWKEGFAGARRGDVTPGGAGALRIVLEQGVEIRGRVMTKGGAKTSVAGMIMASAEDESTATAMVAEDGAFVIRGLRPGKYDVSFIGMNAQSAEGQFEAPAADVVLELPATGEIRGRAIDAVTRQTVSPYTVNFGAATQEVEGDSPFSMHVQPGTDDLTVRAPGYRISKTSVTVEPEKSTEELTIALMPGHAVSGTVSAENGAPIAEAAVSIGDSYQGAELTAESGEYHLDGLPREAFTLQVRANGYVTRKVDLPAGNTDARVDVVLTTGRKVSGHVFTSERLPVEGANVIAAGDPHQNATTDATGAFTIGGLGEGRYLLRATRDALHSETVPLNDQKMTGVVLVMNPSAGMGKVHGVVKGFTGGAWQHAMVHAMDANGTAMIGRDGRYTIELPAGEVRLQAIAMSGNAQATTAPVTVTVIANQDVEANLAFRDDITVRGIVTDSGQPVAGREVQFSAASMRWSTTTKSGGVYEITGLEPGHMYEVQVDGGPQSYTTRHHVTGSGTFDIHIEWARIEGRVVDATGAPLADAKVTLTAAVSNETAGSATTDANGSFGWKAARTSHVLTVAKDGFATSTQRVEADGNPVVVTLTPSAGLRVRLTDARDGRTLDGYVVAVDAAGLQVARADEQQKDGTMLVPLAPGAYRVSISAGGFASQSTRVSVPHAGELRFALTPGGTLVVKSDPASFDLVKLVRPNGEEYVRCECNGIAEIRLTGTSSTIKAVAPGSYTMQVLDMNGLVKTSYPITIAEGQTTVAEIAVPR
jgi:Carboxypeptidase regulatory-like domain